MIPESLGNSTLILRVGVVCDRCNNYFSREVERPFLESPAVLALRFEQSIPSKRDRVPPAFGVLAPHFPAALLRYPRCQVQVLSLSPGGVREVLRNNGGKLVLPFGGSPPGELVISRFLAKAALEAMAGRLQEFPEGLAYLVDEAQLDPIRRHAREGHPRRWPHYARRIYEADRHFVDERGKDVQTVHEYDILLTEWGEYFFVLAIFGLELTINYGGPDIDGYLRWLELNNGSSPLYPGKQDLSRP